MSCAKSSGYLCRYGGCPPLAILASFAQTANKLPAVEEVSTSSFGPQSEEV
jgi:hypothetical protein